MIEGKRLIIKILREKVPFRNLGHIYTVFIPNIHVHVNDFNDYYNITYHITGIFQGGKCSWIRHQPSFCGTLHFHGSDPKSTFHFHKLKWRNFVCFVIRHNSICSLEILKYCRILLSFNTIGPTW